ncbi:ATP-dependent DNA ligase [Spongiactinospora gelatinilytica]|uniref:ATP-dependent DNA ligase n=2 Tax=Spongiactinospora gelatinilytica TaxID=2666298 RepID=A0A2W2FL07_9ACTN|nr:ATP-dependent DNA ligase [Spongiactinospora gelatinilytica]
MLARSITAFPQACPGTLAYEPKLDGFRCLAVLTGDHTVRLQSRRGARLNDAFPEVAAAIAAHVPPHTVLDGEIVCWAPTGRLDFGALQRRNTAGHRQAALLARSAPCHYAAFDLLRGDGLDVRDRPLSVRRAMLEELFAALPSAGVLALGMHTRQEDTARGWYASMHVAGVEGLVIKPVGSRYQGGVRGWMKLKYRSSAEAVAGGFTGPARRPETLLLGRFDEQGRLRVVGRTTRLGGRAAAEIAPLLTPALGAHPWPVPLPPGWAGGPYGRRDPIAYTRIRPELVVEILADTARDKGRHRHPVRLLRPRPDLDPAHVAGPDDAVA